MRGYSDTGTHRHRDKRIEDTRTSVHKDEGIQGHRDTQTRGHSDTGTQG